MALLAEVAGVLLQFRGRFATLLAQQFGNLRPACFNLVDVNLDLQDRANKLDDPLSLGIPGLGDRIEWSFPLGVLGIDVCIVLEQQFNDLDLSQKCCPV